MNVFTLLTAQLNRYPGMQPEDCIKLLYQSYMGPEHVLRDREAFCERLAEELALPDLAADGNASPEDIGHGLCRVHLSQAAGIQPGTLAALCALAAEEHVPQPQALRDALVQLKQWELAAVLGWPPGQLSSAVDAYMAQGCPALHHSPRYRDLYRPHYRLVSKAAALYMPVFVAIDRALCQKPHVLAGIDGMSGAGKSALCALLRQVYGCGAVYADDFFLQAHQRTYERLAQPGGNIDYERLAPVARLAGDDRAFSYAVYNCQSQTMDVERQVPEGRLTILEGVYALHPAVQAPCDVRIFLCVDAVTQASRIRQRSGEALAGRFFAEWIPMENRYFAEYGVREGCDVILDTSSL